MASRTQRLGIGLAISMVAGMAQPASADDATTGAHLAASADDEAQLPRPGWSYLYDGGAIPFIYGAAAVALALELGVDPPDSPRLFDDDEGGGEAKGNTVPTLAVNSYVVAGGLLVAALPGNDARWHHAKGYAEASLTGIALMSATKKTFGRHRPDFNGEPGNGGRQSFFSGHATLTFGTSTYLALYLRGHVFARWRDPGQHLPWWEAGTYALLGGGALYVAATRVDDNRHHTSDAIVGSTVGVASSALFYWWQERRYRREKDARGERRDSANRMTLAPTLDGPGLTMRVIF